MFLQQVHKGGKEFYQFLLTIILVIGGYILGQIPLSFVAAYYIKRPEVDSASMDEFLSSMNFAEIGMGQNLTFFLLLIMFVVAMVGLYFGVTRLHKRSFLSVFTSRAKLDWKRIIFGFGIWILLTIVLEIIGYIASPENYIWQFDPLPFLGLLLIVVVMLPIQTTFEEVFIRGYLMQSLSLLSSSRLMPLIVSSLVFGAMHYMNPEVQEYGLGIMMTYYIGIAVFLGALTLLDGGLELALGIHAATNMYGAVFATFDDSAIRTPALFKLVEVNPSDMAIYSLLAAAFFFFIVVRKYKLNKWWKIFGDTRRVDEDELSEFHSNKALFWSSVDLKGGESDNANNIEDFQFYTDQEGRKYLISNTLSPFSSSGDIQQKTQLGFFEIALPVTKRTNKEELLRWAKVLSKEVYNSALLINKVFQLKSPDGDRYCTVARFPGATTQMLNDWPTVPLLVMPITKEEFDLADSQGAAVLNHKFQELANYPFDY